MSLALSLILAAIWGGIWAALLQWTPGGRYIAARRAWLAVVIGIGIDLLIMLAVIPVTAWLRICAIVACSAIGIIVRSLANELRDHQETLEAVRGNSDADR